MTFEDPIMKTIDALVDSTTARDTAFLDALTGTELHDRTPAAFASAAHATTSPTYSFLPTQRVLGALGQAGFVPVGAAQTRTSAERRYAARHVIRLRRRYETVQLTDSIPEIVFINGHDGRTATQFRLGLFRVVCTNGLIVSIGAMPVWRFPHRSDVLDEVVAAVLAQSELFVQVGTHVERMERTPLEKSQRLAFAEQALELRFPESRRGGMQPSQLLAVRRPEDVGTDLWRTYNVIQENVLKGGLTRRSASNRPTQTRRITAIREDVRLNTALWEMATALAV
jgi:hypothetical protein